MLPKYRRLGTFTAWIHSHVSLLPRNQTRKPHFPSTFAAIEPSHPNRIHPPGRPGEISHALARGEQSITNSRSKSGVCGQREESTNRVLLSVLPASTGIPGTHIGERKHARIVSRCVPRGLASVPWPKRNRNIEGRRRRPRKPVAGEYSRESGPVDSPYLLSRDTQVALRSFKPLSSRGLSRSPLDVPRVPCLRGRLIRRDATRRDVEQEGGREAEYKTGEKREKKRGSGRTGGAKRV